MVEYSAAPGTLLFGHRLDLVPTHPGQRLELGRSVGGPHAVYVNGIGPYPLSSYHFEGTVLVFAALWVDEYDLVTVLSA